MYTNANDTFGPQPVVVLPSSREGPRDDLRSVAPPKTAVIGAGGFLGRRLLAAHRAFDAGAIGSSRSTSEGLAHLDLAAPDIGPLRLAEHGVRQAIVAAGITSIAACQRDAQFAHARNVAGTLELARQLAARGIKTVFLSSDYVFDGATGGYGDESRPRPVNVYGASKAQVERQLSEVCQGNFLIVRLSKVFGLDPHDKTLLNEMAEQLVQGKRVRAAIDQVFCPTLVDDVVTTILALQATDATGVVNVCSPEAWSRFGLAHALCVAIGADTELVEKISLAELGEPFARPPRTDMICRRLRSLVSARFTPIKTCLEQVAFNHRSLRSHGESGNRAA